jgi:mono/diheme cytochrome c family protein
MRKFLLGFVVGILALPVVALGAAWLGMLPTNANATPSRLEKAFAHLALDAAAARHAPHLGNPIPPTEENLMAGMKLFKNDCAGCHGDPNTASDSDADSNLYPSPPPFALHPPRKPDYQLFWIVQGGCVTRACSAGPGNSAKTHRGRTFRMKEYGPQ